MSQIKGRQGYIYQDNNLLPGAILAAAIQKSDKRPLIYPVTKKGNGDIKLYGDYTGAVDANYDIKILDNSIINPEVSAPTFAGAGSGKLTAVNVTGLGAQAIKILCISTGTDTEDAEIEIQGLQYRSKISGAAGNNIYILVDDSPLIFTLTNYSLIEALAINATALQGQEYDFDAKIINGGIIPADAHRLAFGANEVDIYLQYKKFDAGTWKYYFLPEILRPVPAESRVYNVTGGRKITITNGIITEIYTKIKTAADLWTAVKNNSELIEPVNSSIETTRTVNGPATSELLLKTAAYFLPPYKSASSSIYAGRLENIAVTDDAYTELIDIMCSNNDYIGREIWDVRGSASGDMGQAQTGIRSQFQNLGFKIPQEIPAALGGPRDNWGFIVDYAAREEEVDPPPICFNMALGINSTPQTLTLTYSKRAAPCACPPTSFSDDCLGLNQDEEEVITMAFKVEDLQFWTDAVYERMCELLFIPDGNTESSERGAQQTFRDSIASGWDHLTYPSIQIWLQTYIDRWKVLGARIQVLPEDDDGTLTIMVNNYKTLVNTMHIHFSFGVCSWNGVYWSGGVGALVGDSIGGDKVYVRDIQYDTDLYQTLVNQVLLYEKTYGVKKNSVTPGGSCYADRQDLYYWEVRGNKSYLPAFTDVPYYSTIKQAAEYVGTKEYAFLIAIPCGGALELGDKITVTIGESTLEKTYQIGDKTYLPTIAKQNINLSGGIDGDDRYTWEVRGDSIFPAYILDRITPQAYASGGLQFLIQDGIVPFSLGDEFTFNIEGGRFIWRKDSGAWSGPVSIDEVLQTFDEGLRIGFNFGAAPSFEIGDTWSVIARQNNKLANLITLSKTEKWRRPTPVGDATDDLVIDMGSSEAITAIVIGGHNITESFKLQASDASDFNPLLLDQTIQPDDIICVLKDPAITARYWKLELAGISSPIEIAHLFIGSLMQLSLDADNIETSKQYNLKREEGEEPFSLLDFSKVVYNVSHKSFIQAPDFALLESMINYLKINNDRPFYFLPNINYPELCIRARLDIDKIDFASDIDFNAETSKRIYSVLLPIKGSRT
jgi:hypothetical protein